MSTQTTTTQAASGAEDLTADERWNAGLDYGMQQFCAKLGVDPQEVCWDAATETVDGDVRAVIGNILTLWAGDDWRDAPGRLAAAPATAPQPAGAERVDLGGYAPALIHYQDDDRLEYVSSDVATVTRHLGPGFAILLDMETREPVGFYIEQASKLVPASLPAALGSGEGTVGAPASPSGSQASPEAPSDLRPLGFDPSRWELSEEAKEQLRQIDAAIVKPGDPRLDTLIGPGGTAPATDPSPGLSVSIPSGGWRNIISAPRDGTEILAWSEPDGRFIGRFATGAIECWLDDGDSICGPTHWMPLAAPPSALAGEAAQAAETEGLGSRASDGEAGTPKSLATLTASQEQDGEVRT